MSGSSFNKTSVFPNSKPLNLTLCSLVYKIFFVLTNIISDGIRSSPGPSPRWRTTTWTSTTAGPWCWTHSSRSRMRWTQVWPSDDHAARASVAPALWILVSRDWFRHSVQYWVDETHVINDLSLQEAWTPWRVWPRSRPMTRPPRSTRFPTCTWSRTWSPTWTTSTSSTGTCPEIVRCDRTHFLSSKCAIWVLITDCRSIQPWLQRDDEKDMKHGEEQILQSTTDRSDQLSSYWQQCNPDTQGQAWRTLRVYPVRLLLYLVPQLLVEWRQVRLRHWPW